MNRKIDFDNKTILITGGAGFIGSNLALYIQNNFPKSKIIVFDCFRNSKTFPNGNLMSFGHYQNLIDFKGEIICGNINNNADLSLLNSYSFDYIFHHAAISDTRIYDQEIVMKTNVNSFFDLLELTKKNQSTLVYASSAATYGNLPSPQTVGLEKPENPYGYSKYIMDQMAKSFLNENSKLTIVGLRFFNVYGPREYFKGKTSSMVCQLGHQLLNGKAPKLFINSNQIYRDFIYIDDVIQSILNACNPKQNGTYNIGTGVSRSFQDIADILQKELNTSFETDYFPNPFKDYQLNTQADIDTSIKNLDFKPEFSLEEGIKKYIPQLIQEHEIKML
jgi:ADP-L-glycero-D-manno-heptose 6-epimerase